MLLKTVGRHHRVLVFHKDVFWERGLSVAPDQEKTARPMVADRAFLVDGVRDLAHFRTPA